MKLLIRRLLPWGFFVGVVLPVSFVAVVRASLDRGLITVEESWQLVWGPLTWLQMPADGLLGLFGARSSYGAAHAEGWLFWREFILHFSANWICWSLIFGIVALPVMWLRSRLGRRSGKVHPPRQSRKSRPWFHTGVFGGLMGVVLPLFLLGLLILSRRGAFTVLLGEGGLLVHLLTASLLPGEAILYWTDASLVPFSGVSPTMSFWLSSGVLLLTNWAGWLLIAALFVRLLLPKIHARRKG